MKNIIILIILVALVVFGFVGISRLTNNPIPRDKNIMIKLTSTAFADNTEIPLQYSCQGKGINPPLTIEAVPETAKSLALTVADPDAPGGTFIHFVGWNFEPGTLSIGDGSLPSGAMVGKNSGNQTGYIAPCPPTGQHRYIFTVYALDTKLNLTSGATLAQLNKAMAGHIVDSGKLTGLYQKQ